MKVNDKPTGMNNPDAFGMQSTRDQSPHVRPFLSWRFGDENRSMNFFVLLVIQKEQFSIEEFRIIGFYLCHVTSIRPSNSRGASGLLTASLYIDYDRGSSSYYR